MPTVFANITMRGGGSSFYRKNLYKLYGKSVLQYAIELCQQTGFVDDIFVWTEDREAKEITVSLGAQALDRPLEMVHYFSGYHSMQQWNMNRALQIKEITGELGDIHLNLNCNNMLFKPKTLCKMLETLMADPEAMSITAMRSIMPGLCLENQNTGFLMPFWNDPHHTPEEHPALYRLVGVSIAHALRQNEGKTKLLHHAVSLEEGFDFQTQEDVPLALFYLGRRRKGDRV